ncbi:MAG: oligosaccharide flippase family protein [Chloracidobacterium sp.]|nr:oligosaccharide flippase family protein [Chloracidobacterium sp.]
MSDAVPQHTGKSILRNVLYGSMTWFLPLCLSFVATPVIVRSLGNRDYGIYALVLTFIGYSFSFNFGRAITKYIAEYRVAGESEKIKRVISASIFFAVTVGASGVVIVCLLANWLTSDIFQIEADAQQQTVTALYVASATIFIAMMNQLFSSIVQGLHRFDLYSKIYTANGFFTIGGNLALALLGYDLVVLLGWNLVVSLVFCLVYAITAKANLPEFTLVPTLDRATLIMVARFNAGIVGYQLLANAFLLFERGWITKRLGTESLTYYVVPMSFGIYLHAFVSSLVLVLFPLASEFGQDRERLLKLYTKATKIIALIVVFIVIALSVNSKGFLHLWMGPDFADNSSILLVLQMVAFGAAAIQSVAWQMTEGLGRPQLNLAIFSVCLIVAVSLILTLTSTYHNVGIATARAAGFSSMLISIFLIEKLFFKEVLWKFWLRIVFVLAIAGTAAAAAEYAVADNLRLSWAALLASWAGAGVAYMATLFVSGLIGKEELDVVRSFLRR